jgi:hypothetical protein
MLVREAFGLGVTEGLVGLEIEVEGRHLPDDVVGFRKMGDGSLRGESAEFVFKGPTSRIGTGRRVNKLFNAYKERGTRLDNSYRCSSHVHLNVQEFTMTQVVNLFVLYAIFEEYLVKYCGEEREGNLFCLRIRDAEYTTALLRKAIETSNYGLLDTEEIRYGAVNLSALGKYGSVEFRSMRGVDSPEEILTWIDLLLSLHKAAQEYASPKDILKEFSISGPRKFASGIFGELLNSLPFENNWEEIVFSNMRMIQDVAHSVPKAKKPKFKAEDVEKVRGEGGEIFFKHDLEFDWNAAKLQELIEEAKGI